MLVKCYNNFSVKQDGQCACNVTMRRVHATIVSGEKHNYYIFCVCVCVFVELGMQHAIRLLDIVICGLPGTTGGADKSLARPERNQANVSVRMA